MSRQGNDTISVTSADYGEYYMTCDACCTPHPPPPYDQFFITLVITLRNALKKCSQDIACANVNILTIMPFMAKDTFYTLGKFIVAFLLHSIVNVRY